MAVAVGQDRGGKVRRIPHLGYNALLCADGCQHRGPPPGLKAWRFHGIWILVAGGGGLEEEPTTLDLGALRIEVVGKLGIDKHAQTKGPNDN